MDQTHFPCTSLLQSILTLLELTAKFLVIYFTVMMEIKPKSVSSESTHLFDQQCPHMFLVITHTLTAVTLCSIHPPS